MLTSESAPRAWRNRMSHSQLNIFSLFWTSCRLALNLLVMNDQSDDVMWELIETLVQSRPFWWGLWTLPKAFSFHDVTMFVFLHEGILINIVHFKKKINILAFKNPLFVYSGAFYIVMLTEKYTVYKKYISFIFFMP